MWPLRLSIQAWSVGVPGQPKCWAIAHRARNSRVEPEVICGPLSDTHQCRPAQPSVESISDVVRLVAALGATMGAAGIAWQPATRSRPTDRPRLHRSAFFTSGARFLVRSNGPCPIAWPRNPAHPPPAAERFGYGWLVDSDVGDDFSPARPTGKLRHDAGPEVARPGAGAHHLAAAGTRARPNRLAHPHKSPVIQGLRRQGSGRVVLTAQSKLVTRLLGARRT
jgi:hypothetical protein